jgi:uncharacterized membrane protein
MANDNDKLVIAYYLNEAAAEAAAEDLKKWDKANDDIKLGAIGVITLNHSNGEIEVNEVGQRNTRKGALWGTAIGAGLGILTAGIALIPGLIIGAAVGGGIGALDHKSLGMTDEDVHELAAHLKNGGAALGVMCDDFEVEATAAKLAEEGGRTGEFKLAVEAADAVTVYAAAQKSASSAVDEAVDEVAEAVEEAKRALSVDLPDMDETTAAAVSAIAATTGLGPGEAVKLNEAGVDKASDLLQQGAAPAGRKELAEATGVDEETILMAVKRMDLMRINGVGVVYATLLNAAGVETVPDLARRNAANLAEKMAEVNETADVAVDLPSEEMVNDWVEQAKDLQRVITY